MTQEAESFLLNQARQWFNLMISCEQDDFRNIKNIQDQLQQIGDHELQAIWHLNNSLQQPLQKMMHDSESGGQVSQLLNQLQTKIEKIKPPRQTVMARFVNMFKLMFSWEDTAYALWVESYPSQKKDIETIVNQLNKFKRQLRHDTQKLKHDKSEFIAATEKLEHVCDLLNALSMHIESNQSTHSSQNTIQDEFKPIIQNRLIQIKQQLLIVRQTVMTIDLFIKQNMSQISGIDQAVNSTVRVIDITASLAVLDNSTSGLSQQKQSVTKIKSSQLQQARLVVAETVNQLKQSKNRQNKEQSTARSKNDSD